MHENVLHNISISSLYFFFSFLTDCLELLFQLVQGTQLWGVRRACMCLG